MEDLVSLCKVVLYNIYYDEMPLSLFAFSKEDIMTLGSVIRLDDTDNPAIFFYAYVNNNQKYSFVKYSSLNPEKTCTTDNIDEHGYLYGKIINLAEKHPLVGI